MNNTLKRWLGIARLEENITKLRCEVAQLKARLKHQNPCARRFSDQANMVGECPSCGWTVQAHTQPWHYWLKSYGAVGNGDVISDYVGTYEHEG